MRCFLTLAVLFAALGACKGKAAKRQDPPSPPPPAGDAPAVAIDGGAIDAPSKSARLEHTVWSFVDNRATAHRGVDNELVVDARGVSFARYTRFGMPEPQWQYGATAGGERAALANTVATVEVPVIPEQKAPTQVTMRVHGADKQVLELRVNGRKAGKLSRIPLEAGWQTIGFPLEADATVAGENVLALTTSGRTPKKEKAPKVGVSWLRVGATHPSGDQDPLAAATFDTSGDAIELAEHASLTWYVVLPEGAHVVAEVAGKCFVEVGARAGDAGFVGGLLGVDQDRVDLSSLAGKAVRLSLTARDCPRARITHPRVTVHGPAPTLLPKADPPRYVVIWKVAVVKLDGIEELARASTLFANFQWFEKLDRAELGKAVATAAKVQATLIDDATTDAVLARFDQSRGKPGFWFADTSTETGGPHLDRVIEKLKSWSIWDQTMLIVTDGNTLAVHDPARFPSGTIVDEGAEAIDLVPTILDALGLPPDVAANGSSLVPLAQGVGRGWPRPSVAREGNTALINLGGWTLWVADTVNVFREKRTGSTADAGGPIERRLLTDGLGLLLPVRAQWKKSEWGVVSNLTPAGARALDEASVP